MTIYSATLGLVISTFGGAFVLWLLIDKLAWGHLQKTLGVEGKGKGNLSVPLGITERALYTLALSVGAYSWVGVWLAIKVAAQWHRWADAQRGVYNVFLIGNALSILMGFIGACVAIGGLPKVTP